MTLTSNTTGKLKTGNKLINNTRVYRMEAITLRRKDGKKKKGKHDGMYKRSNNLNLKTFYRMIIDLDSFLAVL